MDIANIISRLRNEKGLSPEALAEKLGVSVDNISEWEAGTALPDTDKIIAMSELFGVSTDYILKNGVPGEEGSVQQQASELFVDDGEISPEPAEDSAPTEDTESADDSAPAQVLESHEVPEANDSQQEFASESPAPEKPRKKPVKKIIALILALCILATAIGVPVYFGGIREAWWEICGGKVQYPYVLVHGLGGWGEGDGINNSVQYWGATACDLTEYLTEEGYSVYAPSVGPISSAWDRACELYAQMTGTTVDYGEAHSKEHNHERFGKEYTTPLFEGWGTKINGGQRIKANLVGHSFGGATVRLFASILENGSKAEEEMSGKDVSQFFKGGKGDWIHSVTTLCAPHNGSSLTCVLDSVGGIVGIEGVADALTALCFGVAGISSPIEGVYDFKLEQFGIDNTSFSAAVDAVLASGNDHAVYDLSPDGAAKLNESIKTVDDIYYFSYAYSTTTEGKFLRGQVPKISTLPILSPFAFAMGSYTGTTPGGISIDETWQENDGLVSVVSARYPFNEEYVEITPETEKYKRGIWYVAPTSEGDHGTVIGLNAPESQTKSFYTDLFTMIDTLKR